MGFNSGFKGLKHTGYVQSHKHTHTHTHIYMFPRNAMDNSRAVLNLHKRKDN